MKWLNYGLYAKLFRISDNVLNYIIMMANIKAITCQIWALGVIEEHKESFCVSCVFYLNFKEITVQ